MSSFPTSRQAGQSLIESCIVVAVFCLVFFGVFQVSELMASKEVLHYAAGRGARAKTVGFNQFMVFKTVRVGAIPTAGRLLNPGYAGGPAGEYAAESPRIPLYMGGENYARLPAILDYDGWHANAVQYLPPSTLPDGTLHMEVRQDVSLRYPFHRAFYAADSVELTGESYVDDHYPLYIDDLGW